MMESASFPKFWPIQYKRLRASEIFIRTFIAYSTMKKSIFSILLSILLGGTLAHGALIVVSSGQSIQAAVNGASSGDTVKILNGTYGESVSIIGKAVSLEGEAGGTIQIAQLITANISAQIRLKNLRVDGDVNGSLTDLQIHDCQILGDVNADHGSLTIVKSTVGANISVNHPHRANIPTEARIFQSTIPQKLTCKASKSIIGYNTIRHAYVEGNSEIVGNHFDGNSFEGIGIDVNGSQTYAKIHNNRIHGYKGNANGVISEVFIGVRIAGLAKADLVNNLIYDCYDGSHVGEEYRVAMCIYVESTSGTTIINNALWNAHLHHGTSGGSPGNRLVWAPFEHVLLKNNFLWKTHQIQSSTPHGGGVESVDNIIENNMTAIVFNDLAGGDFTPHPSSALINAGSSLAQYNDRDGTRNDIGMFGGHSFIPNGKTTNKPIVLSLDVAPIAVPAGGTVTIKSTGATVK